MRRRLAVALALAALPALAQTPAPDATPDPIEEARRRIEQIQTTIDAAEEKEAAILEGLRAIDEEITQREADLAAIERLLAEHRKTSEEHRVRMEELERRISDRRKWVKERVRALYVHGRPGYLKVLFSATSYADLVRRTKFSRIVARRDTALMAEMKKDFAEVAESRTEYEAELVSLEEELSKARAKNDALAIVREGRKQLLAAIESDRVNAEKLKAELEKAAKELDAAVGSLGPGAAAERQFESFKGRLLPPISGGDLALGFGPYTHPRLNLQMKHNGIKWHCPMGTDVKAVFDGRVEMSASFSTYGNVIVVDHGDGWRTLYAHNSELLKKKGELVKEGEVIAKTGDTGSFEGPELFFALYRHGEPLDPAAWFLPAGAP